jgi:tetraacyldisaccharide 4'-kinase
VLPALLWPASVLVARATARRVARGGWLAPVPVLCCGNAGVGGSGKTTLVLDLADRLIARGVAVHLLTRGYGGRARGPLRVDPASHEARAVGDEALLLAARAPTWLGADRAATARAAVAAGAAALIMDDGLQNPTLRKSFSFLVIDGAAGFGNARVLPAGPLREPVQAAAGRADAALLIGADATGAARVLPPSLPLLYADLAPDPAAARLAGRRALAFAGIGRPGKFFSMLEGAGIELAACRAFPDHHMFSSDELSRIVQRARRLDAIPVTTPKDFIRIPHAMQPDFTPVGVRLVWRDEPALECLLDRALAGPKPA